MNIGGISHNTVNQFPSKVQHDLEMKQISSSISEMNDAHQKRKEETDEINKQTFS
jgi:hypothetical protein